MNEGDRVMYTLDPKFTGEIIYKDGKLLFVTWDGQVSVLPYTGKDLTKVL